MALFSVRKVSVDPFGEASFELAEDESILDAEFRGGNRIVIAIATPVENAACGVCGCAEPCDHGCCG